ncbi:MAG: Eco57I restriction-modification methylase domain-containing protein, partial [Thermoleophilia bacterium]
GAYQYLLDWHLKIYAEQPGKYRKELHLGLAGEWQLTTVEKKRILLTSIYGVDIDSQAVETTKLSLLLKVLEGETAATIESQLSFLHERALPDLAANIKCGNSLIGSDFYDDQQLGLTGLDEEIARVNAFDWEREFGEVISSRRHGGAEEEKGFDAVIGNPPYVSFYARESIKPDPAIETYLISKYGPYVGGRLNTYLIFLVLATKLRSPCGYAGMIVPDTLSSNQSYESTRQALVQGGLSSVRLARFPVFEGKAHVRTVVPIVGNPSTLIRFEDFSQLDEWRQEEPTSITMVERHQLMKHAAGAWPFGNAGLDAILRKIGSNARVLQDFAITKDGVNPGPRSFRDIVLDPCGPRKSTWRPVIEGKQIRRYQLLAPSRTLDCDAKLLSLDLKKQGASFRSPSVFQAPKLVNRQTADSLIFALDEEGYYTLNSVHNTHSIDGSFETLLFLLGVLNSRLLSFYYRVHSQETRTVFPQVHIAALRRIPICDVDSDRFESRGLLIRRVQIMLDLHKRLLSSRTDHDRTLIERQIAATDKEIDRLVYDLYGLTDDEIAIVESSFK